MPPLRLHFIVTSDRATAVTAAFVQTLIPDLNAFFAPGAISFLYDPARDYEVINDALLDRNSRFVEPRSLLNTEFDPPAVSHVENSRALQAMARRYLGKLVVFCSRGSQLWWTALGWRFTDRGHHYSGGRWQFVNMMHSGFTSRQLAHEIGHYLHVMHTHAAEPLTVNEAAIIMRNGVSAGWWSRANAASAFDGDVAWISDTPPDPGDRLIAAVNGSACGANGAVTVPVDYGPPGMPDIQNYVLAPDRTILVSYFMGCPMARRFSAQQYARMNASLEVGNRQHLITQQETWAPVRPAAAWRDNTLHLVAIGADATAYHAEWREDADIRNFRWECLGVNVVGGTTDGYVDGVALAATSPTELHVVARRAGDGMLLHKMMNVGTGWSPPSFSWTPLGGFAASDPVLVAAWPLPVRLLHLVVRGTDGALWRAVWDGTWRSWQRLGVPPGRTLTGTPSCAPYSVTPYAWWVNGYDVVVRADDRAAWHLNVPWVASPSAWTSLGGVIHGSPTVVAPSGWDRSVVARGNDAALWYNQYSGSVWGGWRYIGGWCAHEAPSAVVEAHFVQVVARAENGTVLHKTGPGPWSPSDGGWYSLGGATLGSPVVVAGPGGRLDVFARGLEGDILHKLWDAAQSSWLPSTEGWFVDSQLIDF